MWVGGMEGWSESDADDMTVVHDSGMIFILIFRMLPVTLDKKYLTYKT